MLYVCNGFRLARSLEDYHRMQIALILTPASQKQLLLLIQRVHLSARPDRKSTRKYIGVPPVMRDRLSRRMKQEDFGRFNFPLTLWGLLHSHGPDCFPGILRFPEGKARKRACGGIRKNV